MLPALTAVVTAATAQTASPWNLKELSRAPAVEWVQNGRSIRSLYYAGEPFQGKPTRVFAYFALPEHSTGPVPAMVLVHGGGGRAFAEWATLWAQRGYAAIAMDLNGCGPDGQRLSDGGPSSLSQS